MSNWYTQYMFLVFAMRQGDINHYLQIEQKQNELWALIGNERMEELKEKRPYILERQNIETAIYLAKMGQLFPMVMKTETERDFRSEALILSLFDGPNVPPRNPQEI